MENRPDSSSGKRKAMFKTLRRLHGQNLDHSGLNDLTEAFATFMTRARFFSIGHLRRTWSHSAVEFMKYRRRLPQLMDKSEYDEDGNLDPAKIDTGDFLDEEGHNTGPTEFNRIVGGSFKEPSSSKTEKIPAPDPRKVYICNVSYRVTTSQLASFFSKFGRVMACSIPHEKCAGTFPRSRKSRGIAYITFKTEEDAEKAKSAKPEELKFYDRTMTVVQAMPQPKRRSNSFHNVENSGMGQSTFGIGAFVAAPMAKITSVDEELTSQSETEPESPLLSGSDRRTGDNLINKLIPDVVMESIFRYLDLFDRVRLERVCKRWQELAFQSWNDHNKLEFRSDQFSIFGGRKPLQNSTFKAILHRCGRYLTSIDLSGTNHFMDEQALQFIYKNCPNLVEIDLTGLRVRWQALKLFAEHCPSMQALTYRNVMNLGEKAFWYLFRNCNNLQRVNLTGCRRLSGRCFRLLGLFLDEVTLNECVRLEPQAIEEICLKSPNVRVLRLNECYRLTDENLNMIARSLSDSLQVFSLCGDGFHEITPSGLANLSRMDRIVELELDENIAVDDEVLTNIAEGCPDLKRISLVQAGTDHSLTENGLCALSDCKQLTYLDLSYLAGVKDSVLQSLAAKVAGIATLRLRGCTYLSSRGVKSLRDCKNLKDLDLSGCIMVGTEGVKHIVQGFPQIVGRPDANNKTVSITIGGTSVDWKKIVTSKSRVIFDVSDYSSAHRCPGVKDMVQLAGGSWDDKVDLEGSSDGDMSDDEFESLTAQRSFVLETLEEDDMVTPEDPFLGWEEHEKA